MKIVYLDNSGFAVDLGETLLLFDYYNHYGTAPGRSFDNGVADEAAIRQAKRVYVFVSHRHFDHYNRVIFELAKWNPNIVYIVDAGVMRIPDGLNAHRLIKRDVYDDGYVKAIAHPSTDIGISFQVEVEGYTLFHAGDLNCWHWAFECSPQEEARNRANFTEALSQIGQSMCHVDVAFFPVDARLKGPYDDGAVEFIAAFHPVLFIPMHFQQNFSAAKKFAEKMQGKQRVFAPARRGDAIEY